MVIAFFLSLSACTYTRLVRQLNTVSEFGRLDKKSPFLKVHMADGRVYVLTEWQESEGERQVKGRGSLLDLNRNTIQQGDFAIPLDGVVLFETNVIKPSPVIMSLAVLSGLSLGLTALCLSNPKACFGSCPTIYAWDGSSMRLQAEAFSASVAPSLEAKDVDELYLAQPSSPLLEVMVTNEALETHVIRSAHVLAAPKPDSGRVFMTAEGDFWQTSGMRAPLSCRGPEGDFLEKIRSFDGIQRSGETDAENLASKETIELAFNAAPDEPAGLVLGFRQTLLTTYLFYQGLAYLGDTSGYWLARLGRGDEKARLFTEALGRSLGGIEVYLEDKEKNWVRAGAIQETGPIATNIQVVPLPNPESSELRVRLRLTKGLWRLDYIALGKLEAKVDPIRIPPSTVVRQKASEFGGCDDPSGLEAGWPLVTMPGDVYSLGYELPGDFGHYELFVETQGYYLEWMRDSWLGEKNLGKARMIFTDTARFLKEMAPAYKKVEAQMDNVFWRSRYEKKTVD
jgi:hypothetical protein